MGSSHAPRWTSITSPWKNHTASLFRSFSSHGAVFSTQASPSWFVFWETQYLWTSTAPHHQSIFRRLSSERSNFTFINEAWNHWECCFSQGRGNCQNEPRLFWETGISNHLSEVWLPKLFSPAGSWRKHIQALHHRALGPMAARGPRWTNTAKQRGIWGNVSYSQIKKGHSGKRRPHKMGKKQVAL